MLNGLDNMSTQIFDQFEKGRALADIATDFEVTLNQVKKLKRLYNGLQKTRLSLNDEAAQQLAILGTKALVLLPLLKDDPDSFGEVLMVATPDMRREDLEQLGRLAKAKQQRIAEFKQYYESYLIKIEKQQEINTMLETKLAKVRKKLKAQLKGLDDYPEAVQEKLLHYVGPYGEQFALRRRLDSGFRRALATKGIIELIDYVWVINDFDAFANQMAKRLKRGYYIEWDEDREYQRNPYGTTSSEDYAHVRSFTEEFDSIESIQKEHEQQIKKLKLEMKHAEQQLKEARSASLQSFQEANEATNLMSKREILRHREMQNLALKWLYNNGYIAAPEVTLPNMHRADVIGYNADKIIIIEVKASNEDYNRDHKWPEYLPYCDAFYFFTDFYIEETQVGQLKEKGRSLVISKEDMTPHACIDAAAVQYAVGRALSRKVALGW
ncbi:MmcB family DNA repair protein [Kurthia huakuii]|uniref:MmcB family DNA repair protein n=2 Tax=Kurthia huakuii TaxID=1421019 RepID=UPI00049566CA|nr:MmcB family DNA repair protein [Kurthia huakuii]